MQQTEKPIQPEYKGYQYVKRFRKKKTGKDYVYVVMADPGRPQTIKWEDALGSSMLVTRFFRTAYLRGMSMADINDPDRGYEAYEDRMKSRGAVVVKSKSGPGILTIVKTRYIEKT